MLKAMSESRKVELMGMPKRSRSWNYADEDRPVKVFRATSSTMEKTLR